MKDTLALSGILAIIITAVVASMAAMFGWIMNLLKVVYLATSYSPDHLVELIVRIIGVPLALLGVVLGWF